MLNPALHKQDFLNLSFGNFCRE